MAKWKVDLTDGRSVDVYAPDEAGARSQADHAERTRFIINVKRGLEPGPSPTPIAEVSKIKD